MKSRFSYLSINRLLILPRYINKQRYNIKFHCTALHGSRHLNTFVTWKPKFQQRHHEIHFYGIRNNINQRIVVSYVMAPYSRVRVHQWFGETYLPEDESQSSKLRYKATSNDHHTMETVTTTYVFMILTHKVQNPLTANNNNQPPNQHCFLCRYIWACIINADYKVWLIRRRSNKTVKLHRRTGLNTVRQWSTTGFQCGRSWLDTSAGHTALPGLTDHRVATVEIGSTQHDGQISRLSLSFVCWVIRSQNRNVHQRRSQNVILKGAKTENVNLFWFIYYRN
jgi:hypothetical protein